MIFLIVNYCWQSTEIEYIEKIKCNKIKIKIKIKIQEQNIKSPTITGTDF